ncbi:MAG TPA: hypothetical protein DGT21_20850 [Armatimonadetes bacterium]|jgi:hypothetical protein|nr:hypothetical protein [Armatimonadota bacterium]
MANSASGIQVARSMHVPRTDGHTSQVAGVGYVSVGSNTLLESLRTAGGGVVRRSEDNGRTWREVERWDGGGAIGEDLVFNRDLPELFLDSDSGTVLRVFNTSHVRPSVIPWDYAVSPGPRTQRFCTQLSHDEGRTWTPPAPFVQSGNEYDDRHWMHGVWFGKNGAAIEGSQMVKTREGLVLTPWWGARLFGDDILNPAIDPGCSNPDGNVEWVTGCLLGRWHADGMGIFWACSSLITLPRKYSCDGADEGSCDYLPDGRLLMVLRARTYPHTGQEAPSLHYYTLSDDEGWTWSECRPLLYDDGSWAYSPACLANVFRSKKNGRFYLITNLAEGPCINCDPRTRCQIAEIDTDTMAIRKDTVTVIDRQPDELGETPCTRFSNFRWFEDRETLDIVLYMTPGGTGMGPAPDCEILGNAYRYDISLPE